MEPTEKEKTRQQKTISDSKEMRGALHLYLAQVANEANNRGLTLNQMVKIIKHLEARPNVFTLKEIFVKPYIKKNFNLDSSMKMDSDQVTEIYDALNLAFGYHFDIHFPFPSRESQAQAQRYDENN